MSSNRNISKFKEMNGIYLAYFSGEYGNSMGIFTFLDGVFCGADLGGASYDGTLTFSDDNREICGPVRLTMKSGGISITGAVSDLPVSYETDVRLRVPIEAVPFHQIQTLSGPVNVRFEKMRSL